jgi:hypothetical protein
VQNEVIEGEDGEVMEFTNQATVGDDGSDSGDEDNARQDAAITAEV